MFGISPWQLLIILVLVILIFGTKKLRNAGSDVGGAVKNFKDAMKDGENNEKRDEGEQNRVIDNDSAQDDKPANKEGADQRRD